MYIGQSVQMRRRKRSHFNALRTGTHRNRHLQNAFDLYGEDNFWFVPLCYCTPLELTVKEQWWMDQEGKKYNKGTAADCPARGSKHSVVARRKIRRALTGRSRTAAERAAISAGKKKLVTPEFRALMSSIRKAAIAADPASIAGLRRWGWKHTPEAIEKMRLAKLGNTYRRDSVAGVKK